MTDGPDRRALRVAYLGDLNPYARSLIRLRALRERGCQVWPIATAPRGSDELGYAPPALWERVARKLGFHLDLNGAGAALLRLASAEPLDLIWVDKGRSISRRVLKAAKELSGASAVSFSEDDMALSHSNSRRWIRALDQYDAVVTTKIINMQLRDLETLGARRVIYVTQSFDANQHFPIEMTPDEQAAFGADISFVGSFEEDRARSILAMAEAGLQVRVWGGGWAGRIAHPNLRIEGRAAVNGAERLDYSKVLTASKISLGFLRRLSRDQHTSRTFEIPACGSLLLAERSEVHQGLFEEGVEAAFFADDAELIRKARYYLEHEDERRRIARAGHVRCLRDYSSGQQLEAVLQALGEADNP